MESEMEMVSIGVTGIGLFILVIVNALGFGLMVSLAVSNENKIWRGVQSAAAVMCLVAIAAIFIRVTALV